MEDVILIAGLVAIIVGLIVLGKFVEKISRKQRKRKKVLRFIEKVSCCG